LVVDSGNRSGDGHNELANSHAYSTKKQEVPATSLFDEVKTREIEAKLTEDVIMLILRGLLIPEF
jgi:hypothetical protein